MSDYIVTTDFAGKDSLATNNPAKVILGSEFDLEFNSIASAIASKSDDVPVYPEFDDVATAGVNSSVTEFSNSTADVVMQSVNFDFVRPSTSGYEYTLSISTSLHGAINSANYQAQLSLGDPIRLPLDGSQVLVNFRLRLTNLQTSATIDQPISVSRVGSYVSTSNGTGSLTHRYSISSCDSSFSDVPLETSIGSSISGYKAELVVNVSGATFTSTALEARDSLFLSGNYSLFIKEVFQ